MSVPAADPAQYRAATQEVAWVDLTTREQLNVVGPDRVSFVQGMVTNDVEKLPEGQTLYAAMLTAKGAMVGDARIVKLPESLVLDTGAGQRAAVSEFLNKYLISEDCEVRATDDFAVVGLLGPKAADLAAQMSAEAVVARLPSLLGERGVDLLVKRSRLSDVKTALAAVTRLSDETFEVLRVEALVPKFGLDMTETTIPLEARLERAIAYQKGCYIGQEVIARATYRGHMNRKLSQLLLGEAAPAPGTELSKDGKKVGWVTSVVRSVARGQNLALGYVHVSAGPPGTALELQGGQTATLVEG